MKQQPGKIGIREYVSIAILMVGAKITEDTPTALFQKVQNAAWMIPIITAVISFIPLFLLIKTMSLYQNKNLFSVIQKLLGKYLGFFVCLLIFIINVFSISFDSRTYTTIIKTFYFNRTPMVIIYAILMGVCAYGAKKGIQHIGSVAYLIIYYAILLLYLAFFLSTQESSIQSLFPIWGPGKLEILKQSTLSLSLFSEFLLFALIIPSITSYKDFRKGTWIALVYVSIQLSVGIIIFICLFDTSLSQNGYPFHTAIRFISIGTFFPNIEIIFFVIWLMAAFIRFTAFLYINALMFGQLFKIKDFEFLIPSLATLYLLIGSIPESPYDLSLQLKPILRSVTGPTLLVISITLWLVALLKGEFKHEKNRGSI
ncbi:GerAB/ArcD/ProY family transporter [Bacillus sp. UNC41MFS5]|uniref:GerAB/ArcD/ProY family transporter n=1 Tax=Bacillus sp. UNC41MFS5 TaxID=1449046 RepID=UPI00047D82A8|nr:GerAB/ArcD/ProY family transporter [Bacillus sp. UNC41MFS5]